jgi:hypothetical protein
MTRPEDPHHLPIPLLPEFPLPAVGPLPPAAGLPLPPLDESHWSFVFLVDRDDEEEQPPCSTR